MATTIAKHLEERQSHALFVCQHAESEYRGPLAPLYALWHNQNKEYFDGQLMEPHLEFGRTAHNAIGHCELTTNYGGRLLTTLNKGLVIDPKREWIRIPWPAEGVRLFMEDLVLRFTVRQYVLEILEKEEKGYRGYGPAFAREANRIGIDLGIGMVSVRRRPGHDDGPPCIGWPHCVRPAGYYGDDITEDLLTLAVGRSGGTRSSPVQMMGILELVQYLLVRQRADEAERMIARHLAWTARFRRGDFPVRRRMEDMKEDVDGFPLGPVSFDRAWIDWNHGTVEKIAQSVKKFRSFGDLPILADALEEAGCTDERIVRHLRSEIVHDSRCWVLRHLLALKRQDGTI